MSAPTHQHPAADGTRRGEDLPLLPPGSENEIRSGVGSWDTENILSKIFDTEKGFLKYWNIVETWRQITTRERDPDLYCIDGFRVMAFLWTFNQSAQFAFKLVYYNFRSWMVATFNKSITTMVDEGVVIFYTISGFINFYYILKVMMAAEVTPFSIVVVQVFFSDEVFVDIYLINRKNSLASKQPAIIYFVAT